MKRSSRNKHSPIFAFVGIVIALVICLFGLLLAYAVFQAADTVQTKFGPPSPNLSRSQRIYLSAQLLASEKQLSEPANPQGQMLLFEIRPGDSANEVINRLNGFGFISSADSLRIYMQYTGIDTRLQTGAHRISPAMTPIEIAQAMASSGNTLIRFGVLPGWRAEELAASLPTSGITIKPQDFLTAVNRYPDGLSFSNELPDSATAEGLLFPDIYQLPRNLDADQLVKILLEAFDQQLTPEMRQRFQKQDLSIYQAIILASLVQREAMITDEMPVIASVFLNRLGTGMKLDSDPTIQYALGYTAQNKTWWKTPLTSSDMDFKSPYNTYLHPGLPPGPIANPGLSALNAVAFPAHTDYLYFRAACDNSGKHVFSTTFNEHLQHACP